MTHTEKEIDEYIENNKYRSPHITDCPFSASTSGQFPLFPIITFSPTNNTPPKPVPRYCLYCGNEAKVICEKQACKTCHKDNMCHSELKE